MKILPTSLFSIAGLHLLLAFFAFWRTFRVSPSLRHSIVLSDPMKSLAAAKQKLNQIFTIENKHFEGLS
jgi:hypothetical protein